MTKDIFYAVEEHNDNYIPEGCGRAGGGGRGGGRTGCGQGEGTPPRGSPPVGTRSQSRQKPAKR